MRRRTSGLRRKMNKGREVERVLEYKGEGCRARVTGKGMEREG